MQRIEKRDIDRYHSFLPQLEYAIGEAVRLSNYKSREKFLNASDTLADLNRAYGRSIKGQINLDSLKFKKIILLLRSSGVDSLLIDELKASYEVYFHINLRFNSKNSAFRGAGYLTRENAVKRFYDLLDAQVSSLGELVADDDAPFEKFLDDTVERPFANNDARTAITNAYAITLFVDANREYTFKRLNDESFFARLSLAARIGAWTCQAVSQRGTFDFFLKVLEKAAHSRVRKSVVGYHAIKWHEAYWRGAIDLPFERNHALRAFEALADGRSANHRGTSFDSTIILNVAHEAVRLGASPQDRIQSNIMGRYTVGDLIRKADEIPIPGAYELGSRVVSIAVKARSLINAGDLDAAREELNKGWGAFFDANSKSSMLRYRLKFTQGLLEQKQTGKLENVHLREAYELAVETGAFHYAIEAAKLMGWK